MLPCTTKAEAARRYFITPIRGTVHEQNKIDTSLFFSRPRQGGGEECAIKPSKTCQWKTKHFFYIRTQIPTYWFAFHSGLFSSCGVVFLFSAMYPRPSPQTNVPHRQRKHKAAKQNCTTHTRTIGRQQQNKFAQRTLTNQESANKQRSKCAQRAHTKQRSAA